MNHKLLVITILILGCSGIVNVGGGRPKHIPKWKKQACEFPLSRNDQSHYNCDQNGEVKCLPGWQGDLCDVPFCKRGCDPMNGYCDRPGECRCKLGFYGKLCNKCIPLPGCQQGYCKTSFQCICHKGWEGLFCSEPICQKDCHVTRGYCENPGECRCRLGWSGPTCHDCQVLPGCQSGTCTKPLECNCLEGYSGILCQTPTCSANCHRQHGYCRRPGECRCKVGWMGKNCSECHAYPGCLNGDCQKPWECNCRPGWGGILCDEELNYCELNPETCQHEGKCISRIKIDGDFRCICQQGFSGKRCEISAMKPTVLLSNSTSFSSGGNETLSQIENTSQIELITTETVTTPAADIMLQPITFQNASIVPRDDGNNTVVQESSILKETDGSEKDYLSNETLNSTVAAGVLIEPEVDNEA